MFDGSGGGDAKSSKRVPFETMTVSTNALIADDAPPDWVPESKTTFRLWIAFWCFALLFHIGTFIGWRSATQPLGPSYTTAPAPMFGWHFMYLTILGGYMQAGYFVHCLIDAYVVGTARAANVHWHRDRFFMLTFTIMTFICLAFWIAVYDPKDFVGQSGEFALTVMLHGGSGVIIWIEMFWVPHRYGKWLSEMSLCLAWAVIYLAWNLLCYTQNNRTFVYAFQQNLVGAGAVVYLGLFLAVVGVYFGGRLIVRWRWDDYNQNHNGCCCLRLRAAPAATIVQPYEP